MNDAKPQTRRVLDACRPDIKREPHPLAAARCAAPRHPHARCPATSAAKHRP